MSKRLAWEALGEGETRRLPSPGSSAAVASSAAASASAPASLKPPESKCSLHGCYRKCTAAYSSELCRDHAVSLIMPSFAHSQCDQVLVQLVHVNLFAVVRSRVLFFVHTFDH